jgi:hypothetical protein
LSDTLQSAERRDAADTIHDLCSPLSDHVAGQALAASGGAARPVGASRDMTLPRDRQEVADMTRRHYHL